MEFRIADTFTDSLSKLTGPEQTAAKTTAFDLQANPSNPGLQFHRLDKSKDKNFWSIRVNRELRVIVHRSESSLLLCYVDHHDRAYAWAERRKLEVHPNTGALQMVEVRESVQEVIIPKYVEVEQPRLPLFSHITEEELLGYGIPQEWLRDVREIRDEDSLLRLVDHLPAEAADALLILADGGKPESSIPEEPVADPFKHPDAERRFRTLSNVEELTAALESPWEKWIVFLHPSQRSLAEKTFSGPARVSGSAGTGKTVVALHRTVNLARTNPDARLLLATFSIPLANLLRKKLKLLAGGDVRLLERIEVHSLTSLGKRLYELRFGRINIASKEDIANLLDEIDAQHPLGRQFLLAEWEQIVDERQLDSWDAYRNFARLGRKARLSEKQREMAWQVFEGVRQKLSERGSLTPPGIFARLADDITSSGNSPFDFAVIDEAQDLNPSQLRFLAALGDARPNSLFFAGDLGQRIFQQAFSWLSCGVDIRGRSRGLKINYRTSHQIRSQADRLLGPEVADVDGIVDQRKGTVSVFNGPPPEIRTHSSTDEEISAVADWLEARVKGGVPPHEIGVFVRSADQIDRAVCAVQDSGMKFTILDEDVESAFDHVSVGTMHLAKGLEFRAVVVMACDDEVIPLQQRIESIADESDLEEVYATERHLLYVACTRARDYLIVTAAEYPSEFLEDLLEKTMQSAQS